MSNNRLSVLFVSLSLFFSLLLSACGRATPPAISTSSAQTPGVPPTGAEPALSLTICLGQEPNTLYLHGNPNAAARAVLNAIYDGPIDQITYAFQPTILESIPNLADGSARIETVTVTQGARIVDSASLATTLEFGRSVQPAGCRSSDCAVSYQGGEVQMERLVVTFHMKSGLTWADGAPLTASDSVYSFQLNSDPATPAGKFKTDRTDSYAAPDEVTIVWSGVPGFLDETFESNFWTPLPRHVLEETSAADLLIAEDSARRPLGYGPFQIRSWSAGESITLQENPNYFRSDEGLPLLDALTFRFVENPEAAVQALLDGECDILDPTIDLSAQAARLVELQSAGEIQLAFAGGSSWQHLDFGIVPFSYENGYTPAAGDRPDFFGDVRTRQAIAACLDRGALAEQFAFGQPAEMDAYVASDHPLHSAALPQYAHDPAAGSALLEQVGWQMGDDGVRVAQNVANVPNGTRFEVTYFTLNSEENQAIAQAIGQDLLDCGIKVILGIGTPEELFATGASAPLFGRRFDLAQFAWPLAYEPSCYLYLGEAVPGEDLDVFPYGWGGWNLTGWRDAAFDAACKGANAAIPGEDAYASGHLSAQEIFAAQLPVIPLFADQSIIAARPDLCGLLFDPTAGALWNLEMFGYGDLCN